jgi:hypothetical protein
LVLLFAPVAIGVALWLALAPRGESVKGSDATKTRSSAAGPTEPSPAEAGLSVPERAPVAAKPPAAADATTSSRTIEGRLTLPEPAATGFAYTVGGAPRLRVRAVPVGERPGATASAWVAVDAEGRFAIPVGDGGRYRVVGRWTPTSADFVLAAEIAAGDAFPAAEAPPAPARQGPAPSSTVRPAADTSAPRVKVVGPDGQPVPKFELRLSWGARDGKRLSGFGGYGQGADGSFPRDTQRETWDTEYVVIRPRDAANAALPYAPAPWRPADDPDATEPTVRLAPGRAFRGRLVDPRGAPIANVEVKAHPLEASMPAGYLPEFHDAATTDSTGGFSFDALGEGGYRCLAKLAPPLVPAEGWTIEPGQRDGTLTTQDGITVRITVVDYDGKPVAGANAWPAATPGSPPPLGAMGVFPPAGTDGVITLGPFPPGATLRLQVSGPAARQDLLGTKLEAWAPADATVRLERGWTVKGVVQGPDGPVSGAVQVKGADGAWALRAGTMRDGKFTLMQLPAGPVTIRASSMPPGRSGPETTVEAGATDVVLTLPP